MTLEELPSFLFAALRQMDDEATSSTETGAPTGLSYYGGHARQDLSKPQTEVEWSRRIVELLAPKVSEVRTEAPYPDYAIREGHSRQRCDVVFRLPEEGYVWLEVKGAWRDYWGGSSLIYRCYLLHPLLPNIDAGKAHTVPFDLEKLAGLRSPEADHVAELLIGFERPDDPMLDDVATLVDLAKLAEWNGSESSWMSSTVPNQRVRAWLWHRPAEA